VASKTPKSNQTSSTSQASKALKTTATSKAATKKPVAKKAAAARGPAVAAEPPAPAKKAAKKTVARKAAATTAAAARPAAAKPAARAATTKAAAAKASTAKPAAKASAKKAAAEVEKIAAPPAAPAKAAPRKTSSRKAAIKDTAAASAAVAEAAAVSVPGDTGTAPVAAAVEQAAHETPAAPASSAPGPARASEPASARTPTMERTGERAAPDASIDTSPEASTEARAAESPKANTEANTEASTAASTDTRTEPTTAASTEASIAASAPAQPAHAAEAPAPASAAPASASEPAGEDDEARNVKAKDAPADGPAEAAEDKRPRVLRRAGAGKPARPAVKPSWATYPEPLQGLVDAGRRMLGIDNLRPGQAEALVHVMNRRDLLAVMPTGSGKSLLYQLPSLVLDGLTVVVSPLIALIKDQLDKMEERGVAVCRFDSTLTVKQRRDAEALVQAPGGKLVFVTPERISDPEFRAFLRTGAGGRGVALFVVDEAHCVSQWGHDFRPSYLTLRKAIDDLGRPPLLATTATAPPHVREDILHQLGMPEAAIVTTTFERPNLHFEVMALPSEEDKLKTLVTLLKKLPRPGVVYCATVKKVEELYESLTRHAIPVARYHGRMGKKDRDTEQERLMDAKDMVMIATNAFGLGVDKANIRYVLHYHVPGSLEAYAQEAGRGGRDGKPSRCVLMFSPDDVAIQEYFLTGTYPSRRQVRAVFKALQIWSPSDEAPPTIANLALSSHVGTQRTRTVLSLLKDEGFVVEREEGTFWLADDRPSDEVLSEKAKQYEARRIADRQRLDALLAYVKTPRCRNQVILEYLGEPESQPCGRCDNCQRSREAALAAADQASRLEAKATAELNQEWSADSHDREADEENKPRRVIRHRVIRIDEPAVEEQAAKPAADEVKAAKPAADEVRTRAAAEDGTAAPDDRSKRPSNGQMRLPLNEPARANGSPVSAAHVVPAATPVVTPAVAATIAGSAVAPAPAASADGASVPASTDGGPPWAAPAGAGAAPVAPAADEDGDSDEYDDDEYIDDEDGDEYIDDEEGDEDEYEDEEYEDEDEDDEEYEDEDDEEGDEDEEYEDEDDDDEEYEDEEGEDDEEYDDEDFELIEKTAAALAEEGIESDTEITILARKRVEKPRPQKAQDSAAQSDADSKRRRKRRRRRKKRSMLPPKSAFITPVLSKESEVPVGPSRGRRRKAGPVIEYVRGPMRINMTPVASATPNDVAPSRKKKKRRRRGDEPVYPGMAAAGNGASAPSAPPSDENGGRKRRRRRRRRKRAGGSMRPMQHEGPVTFFSTQWPAPDAGARDEGGRRRRRRKRRSRNGRPGSQGGRTEPPPSRPLPPPSGE
jgi:ATP-dependent DNA helicase RecQ